MKRDLPSELWLNIFDVVLHVPGSLDIDFDEPFQRNSAFWNTPLFTVTSQKITGRAALKANAFALQLMLVSKSWHDLAITKLYRHLQIRNHRHLPLINQKLASMIPSYGLELATEHHALGSLVRRIDFSMDDVPRPSPTQGDFFSAVYTLLKLTPNIQIMEFISTRDGGPLASYRRMHPRPEYSVTFTREQWEKIAFYVGSSLRRLEISEWEDTSRTECGIWHFLKIFPRLRTIRRGVIFREESCWLCFAMSQSRPISLHALGLENEPWHHGSFQCPLHNNHTSAEPGPVPSTPFPDLSNVVLDSRSLRVPSGSSSIVRHFFRLHGAQITTAYLIGFDFGERPALITDHWHPDYPDAFRLLRENCPRLNGLILFAIFMFSNVESSATVQNEYRLANIKSIPRTVTRLAVHMVSLESTSLGPAGDIDYRRVVCWLATPEIRDTSIRSIVIYEIRQSEDGDIWSRDGMTSIALPSLTITHADAAAETDEHQYDDSPEDLFATRVELPEERFIGAMRRLMAWGISVDVADSFRPARVY